MLQGLFENTLLKKHPKTNKHFGQLAKPIIRDLLSCYTFSHPTP